MAEEHQQASQLEEVPQQVGEHLLDNLQGEEHQLGSQLPEVLLLEGELQLEEEDHLKVNQLVGEDLLLLGEEHLEDNLQEEEHQLDNQLPEVLQLGEELQLQEEDLHPGERLHLEAPRQEEEDRHRPGEEHLLLVARNKETQW